MRSRFAGYMRAGIARALSLGFQFLLIYCISNLISLEAVGFYGPLVSFCLVAGIALNFGQSTRAYMEIPTLVRHGDKPEARSRAGGVLLDTLFNSAIGLLPVTLVATMYFRDWISGLLAGLVAMAFAAIDSLSAILRGLGFIALAELVRNGFWRMALVVCVIVFASFSTPSSPQLLVPLLLLSVIGVTFLVIITLRLPLRNSLKSWADEQTVNFQNWGIQCFQALSQNIDILLTPWIFGLGGAATYFIATRLAAIVALPLSITNPVITPVYSQIARTGYEADLAGRVWTNTAINVASSILLAAAILIGGDWFAALLTGKDVNIWLIIAILAFGQVANTIVGPSIQVSQLFAVRSQTIYLQIFSMLVVVVFAFAAHLSQSIVIFALGVSAGKILMNLGIAVLLRHLVGLNLFTGRFRPSGFSRTSP